MAQAAAAAAAPEAPAVETPAPETPAAETPQAAPPAKGALDELFGDDAPEWLKNLGAVDAPPVTMKDLEALPIEAKGALAQVRAYGQQAAAAAAEAAAKQAEKERELAARERMLARRAADPYAFIRNPKVRELIEAEVGEAPADPYSPEGIQHAAEVAANTRIQAFLAALAAAEQEQRAAAEAAEAAAKAAEVEAANEAYIAEHLDTFEDPEIYSEVARLFNGGKRDLTLQECHELAVAKITAARLRDPQMTAVQQSRIVAKERLASGGRRAPAAGVALPEKPTRDDIQRLSQESPENLARAIEQLRAASSYSSR